MRPAVVLLVGAVVLSVAGCATTRTASPHSTVLSSELAASQPVASQPAVSEAASTGPARSGPASTGSDLSGPTLSQPASVVASPAPASGSPEPALERRLWALALNAAIAEGGTIKEAQAVRSTHQRAVAMTMGDSAVGDQPVWVIQVEGAAEFVCDTCTGPKGAPAPRGRFQVLVVDASTFQTWDFSLSDRRADLTQLGPVVDLHP